MKPCEDCSKAENFPQLKEHQFTTGSQFRELYGAINLRRFCDKCLKPCSVCKKTVQHPHLEVSNYNGEPICSECKVNQCYRCGEEGEIKTWYEWTMCETCAMELCNTCGGECDKPCSKCERPCDNCYCSDDDEDSN
jgi:hypothetical protein